MSRRLKNAVIYAVVRALVGALGLVPAALVRPVGLALGALGHRLAGRERRRARTQISRGLGLDPTSRRVRLLVRGVFAQLGLSAVEVCRLRHRPAVADSVAIPEGSRRALEAALREGRGVVFATGHLGNWELMAVALARAGFPITAIAKESYDPRFTRLVEDERRRLGVEVIHRGRPGSSAATLRALRAGRVIGLLIDQDTRVPGTFVPFFGAPAFTPTGAAALAVRTGAPLVVGSIRRTPRGGHVVEVDRCEPPVDTAEGTASLTAALERRIRRHPSQWVWFHERWKTRPAPA
ncbi:MAG: lysophospholipid acyltransferase family protein [Proteobacteria bacterium]|nr:lysophospholipid acyltransferase family protein [Pseudomonadota bacterium]